MNSTQTFSIRAFIILLIGGISIGFAPIFMRFSDVGPIASAFWRFALASPLLWGWALFTIKKDHTAEHIDQRLSTAIIWSGIFFAGDMSLWHLSLHYTTVSNATLLPNLAPVFVALWIWYTYRTPLSILFVVGLITALLGSALLVGTHSAMNSIGNKKWLGDCLGLFTTLFYAGYQLKIKEARLHHSTAYLMAWTTTITALALLPLMLISPNPAIPQHLSGWLPLFGLAFVGQIGGQTLIANAMAHLPASLSSISLLIQPLTATIAAWWWFQENLNLTQIFGGLLLLYGIYLAKRGS